MRARLIGFVFLLGIINSVLANEHEPYQVADVSFDGTFYPAEKSGKYGIMVLNGSAGGKNEFMAKKFNEMGHPVLSLAYFDWESTGNLPNSMELIPLESIAPAKEWLMTHAGTRNDGVVVYGLSKGAELALLLASLDSDYKAVIATAPSAVVWVGIPQKPGNNYSEVPSSWSYGNNPVNYIQYLDREPFRAEGITMLDWHDASLKAAENFSEARIKVENIKGPILLFSGGKDTVWSSVQMGETICAVANLTRRNSPCKHVVYKSAPHILGDYGPDARLEMGRMLDKLNETVQ